MVFGFLSRGQPVKFSFDSDSPGPSGHLKAVVTAVLPPHGAAQDAPTRAMLMPVLCSLLKQPSELVAANVDALSKSGSGHEFALALLAAASGPVVAETGAETALMGAVKQRRADDDRLSAANEIISAFRAENAALEALFEERKAEHAAEKAEHAAAQSVAVASAIAERDAFAAELARAREDARETERRSAEEAERVTSRVCALERQLAQQTEVASQVPSLERDLLELEERRRAMEAARDAVELERASLEATRDDLVLRGFDAELAEYIRGTLVCFLRGLQQPQLRTQLMPILVRILKISPDDEKAKGLLEFANTAPVLQ